MFLQLIQVRDQIPTQKAESPLQKNHLSALHPSLAETPEICAETLESQPTLKGARSRTQKRMSPDRVSSGLPGLTDPPATLMPGGGA